MKQFTARQKLQKDRLDLIKTHGFGSSEYLDKLIDHQAIVEAAEKEIVTECLKKLKVDDKIYELSYETFVGDESVIDLNFVKASIELISCHHIKSRPSTDAA